MKNIFSIRNGVDETLLLSSIEIYRNKHRGVDDDPYIFLNKETFDDLYRLLDPKYYDDEKNSKEKRHWISWLL